MTAEAMGFSVQGDLNAQELADINRLVGELTSIASTFFSGDYEDAMTKAMDFGDLGLGSVSSLTAAFSSQTVSQTRITSQSSLPAMADLEDLYRQLETDRTDARDYAALLEARWQQILKALDEKKKEELDGLFARRMEPLPVVAQDLDAGAVAPASPEEPPAVPRKAEAPDLPAVPASEEAARQMLARLEQLFADHPKVTPFAKALAATAMEKAASRAEQPRPDTAPRTVV
jgi:hypothetical protein